MKNRRQEPFNPAARRNARLAARSRRRVGRQAPAYRAFLFHYSRKAEQPLSCGYVVVLRSDDAGCGDLTRARDPDEHQLIGLIVEIGQHGSGRRRSAPKRSCSIHTPSAIEAGAYTRTGVRALGVSHAPSPPAAAVRPSLVPSAIPGTTREGVRAGGKGPLRDEEKAGDAAVFSEADPGSCDRSGCTFSKGTPGDGFREAFSEAARKWLAPPR
jgi:hypothetical protein